MRLDKFIAACTNFSRSQAKKIISQGDVSVDGVIKKDPSIKITNQDEVFLQGGRIQLTGARYIMLHKPAETVCTSINDDSRSVMNLLGVDKPEDLHIAGRLDIDTTGLVLITDDGVWSHKVTSPKKKCSKRYRVGLADVVQEADVVQFKQGVQLKDEAQLTRPAELEILSSNEVLLTIHEGKYHQVKRMFASLSNRVISLHREQVGFIQLDSGLAAGEWRYLTELEISSVT
ncbi:MAG: 16S rRNA pseudouridine516 synthase [Oleiphilaceae bacterium]|jgi:16S rRNA pseudouridine516 synthase